jgi:hypothetical protein
MIIMDIIDVALELIMENLSQLWHSMEISILQSKLNLLTKG